MYHNPTQSLAVAENVRLIETAMETIYVITTSVFPDLTLASQPLVDPTLSAM